MRDEAQRGPVYFDISDQPWADKVVLKLHLYSSSEDIDMATSQPSRPSSTTGI